MGSAIPTHLRCPRTRAPWVGEDFQPPYPSFSARAPQAMTQVVMGYFGVQSRGGREVVDAAFATVLALFDAIDGPSHRDIVCLVDGDGYDTAMAIAYWGEAEAFSRWIDDPRVAGWRAFKNQYWPAHYFIDATGKVRHTHFGEGAYAESETIIQGLLGEAGRSGIARDLVAVDAKGVSAASDKANVASPEIYIGYERAENFVAEAGAVRDRPNVYARRADLGLNQWSLTGDWTVQGERAVLNAAGDRIRIRFHARDLHLVLGPPKTEKPVRFRITIDGRAPGGDHGVDVDAKGDGVVTEARLYQLVRQGDGVTDRVFEIKFLAPGGEAFAFTFG